MKPCLRALLYVNWRCKTIKDLIVQGQIGVANVTCERISIYYSLRTANKPAVRSLPVIYYLVSFLTCQQRRLYTQDTILRFRYVAEMAHFTYYAQPHYANVWPRTEIGIRVHFRTPYDDNTFVYFTARHYASAKLAVVMSVCPSVCPSVRTRRYCIKTAKRRIKQTTLHESPGTLVFGRQRFRPNWNRDSPRGRRMQVG